MSKETFKKALNFLYPSEGGYSNNKNDKGGSTNLGITQSTYNYYCRKYNLPAKNVRYITRDEATRVYYSEYWKGSGADKISETNPKMAVAVFDTAVLHGPAIAKSYYQKSGGDLNKYLEIRKQSYDKIVAKDSTQKEFYNGWNNRVNNLKIYLNKTDFKSSPKEESQTKTLKASIEYNVDKNENNPKYMDKNGNRVYTREDLKEMSKEEQTANHDAIMKQYHKMGVPTQAEIQRSLNRKRSQTLSELRDIRNMGDHWVTINGNHVLMN